MPKAQFSKNHYNTPEKDGSFFDLVKMQVELLMKRELKGVKNWSRKVQLRNFLGSSLKHYFDQSFLM